MMAAVRGIFFDEDDAAAVVRRLVADGGKTPNEWVTRAFALALSRSPGESEKAASVAFVARQVERRAARDKSCSAEDVKLAALADFCQALFGLNEFVYVD